MALFGPRDHGWIGLPREALLHRQRRELLSASEMPSSFLRTAAPATPPLAPRSCSAGFMVWQCLA